MSTYNKKYYELNKDKYSAIARNNYRERLSKDPEYLEKKAKSNWIKKQKKLGLPFNPDDYVYRKREKDKAAELKIIAFNKELFIEGTITDVISAVSGLTKDLLQEHINKGTAYKGWCFDQVE